MRRVWRWASSSIVRTYKTGSWCREVAAHATVYHVVGAPTISQATSIQAMATYVACSTHHWTSMIVEKFQYLIC